MLDKEKYYFSSAVTCSTSCTNAPTPNTPTIAAGNTQCTITENDTGTYSYRIKQGASGTWYETSSRTFTGLTNGTAYTFYIQRKNTTGSCTSWSASTTGSCSATACGGSGTQTRTVTCQRSDGTTVADSYCTGNKPSTSQSCTCSDSSCTCSSGHYCSSGGSCVVSNCPTPPDSGGWPAAKSNPALGDTDLCNAYSNVAIILLLCRQR